MTNRRVFGAVWCCFAAILLAVSHRAPLRVSVGIWTDNASGGKAQLFWCCTGDSSFNEVDSSRVRLNPGNGTYRMSVPAYVGSLRLDPIGGPGHVAIEHIRLSNALGLPLASWVTAPAITDWQPNAELRPLGHAKEGWLYKSTGRGPFLEYTRWPGFIAARRRVLDPVYAVGLGWLCARLAALVFRKRLTSQALSVAPVRRLPAWKTALFALVTAAVSTATCGALVELVFRAHLRKIYGSGLRAISGHYQPAANPSRVYEFRKDLWNHTYVWGSGDRSFSFHLNSLGFRGREWDERRGPDKRLLVIGDSFTFGWAVDDADPFPTQAEALFRSRGGNVEVLNGGIPGYTTLEEQATLEELALRFHPDAVVLAVTMNDAQPSAGIGTPPEITYHFARLWSLEELKDIINLAYDPARPLLRSNKIVLQKDYFQDFRAGNPAARASKEALAAMARFCAAQGIYFLVLIYPDVSLPLEQYPYLPIHHEILSWCRELSLPVYDLLDDLRGKPSSLYRVPWDGHPSREAHQVAAQVVVRLVSDGLDRPLKGGDRSLAPP